jgi:CRISPR-associated protein Cas2
MWVMVMFDLPVVTKPERKAAQRFRSDLLDLGFQMAQYSVYMRFCASDAQVTVLAQRIRLCLPASGRVSLLTFTDKQYERIINFSGGQATQKRPKPAQLEIF